MNGIFFQSQVQRLILRFGQRNFDPEFCKLIFREVDGMSEQGFLRFCDVLIGSRTPNKPPLLTDFREARLNEQKHKFENDVRGATQALTRRAPEEMRKYLRQVLSHDYGGVESVKEALEIARLRLRTK